MELTSADSCLIAAFLKDIEKFLQAEMRRAYKDKDANRKQEVKPLLDVAQLIDRRLFS